MTVHRKQQEVASLNNSFFFSPSAKTSHDASICSLILGFCLPWKQGKQGTSNVGIAKSLAW